MKKSIFVVLALLVAGLTWAQYSPSIEYPTDMVMGELQYQVTECFVCAKNMAEATKIMNNYITTYNIKKKVVASQKCCNFIDKNVDPGIIVKFTLESSALD